jgi:hypothetical protein
MKAQLQALIQEHTRTLNRISMAMELMPDDENGPTPLMISEQVGGSISYAAGENNRNLPALLAHFGSDGWHLYALDRHPYLFKLTVMNLAIQIEHVDPAADFLPDCVKIPTADQAVS